MTKKFKIGIDNLTTETLFEILENQTQLDLSPAAIAKINTSRNCVENIVKKEKTVYGINTGFGPLCDKVISTSDVEKLQENLLISHAVGVGEIIDKKISKIMLILKAHALAQGFSGIKLETIERILWHIKNDIIPAVPQKGSVGASGDLAPLAHLFLPLIGFGEIFVDGKITDTAKYFSKNNIKPIKLSAKEGLALINGTQFIAAFGCFGLYRMSHLLEQADIIAAMSLDGLCGSAKPFDPRLHDIRPFIGNKIVAEKMSKLLAESEIANSHTDCKRVQDPYSLRCIAQVHGASRNAFFHGKEMLEIEINSVTDNPIVLNENEIISGGGFHGQPIAMICDYLTLAAAELGNIADRRCYLMLEGKHGLPALLMNSNGLDSGFMIPQYTTAALVSENKSLCFPASADSIPTSMGQEDHVSMGSISAVKFNKVLDNLEFIQAIELLYAAQALEFRRPLKSSKIIEKVFSLARKEVAFKTHDSLLGDDIKKLHKLITKYEIAKFS